VKKKLKEERIIRSAIILTSKNILFLGNFNIVEFALKDYLF
jgi:hypothetical protein